MRLAVNLLFALPVVVMLIWLPSPVYAADPGTRPIPGAGISDQKTGSVLFYPLFSSNAATPGQENTRLTITNTNTASSITIHLMLINGNGGIPAMVEFYFSLTPSQTLSFQVSEIHPGARGYAMAVAVDRSTGCPINFNYLSGSEYIKLATGHAANLGAEAVSALKTEGLTACDDNATSATLRFDDLAYERLPRVLAIQKMRSPADGNSMLLVLNRIGGSLVPGEGGPTSIGTVTGELIDNLAASYPYSHLGDKPQLVTPLSNTFPITTPVFDAVIAAGKTGWLTVSGGDVGLLGAAINYHPNTSSTATAFNGGHNLRKLNTASATTLTIPVSPPQM